MWPALYPSFLCESFATSQPEVCNQQKGGPRDAIESNIFRWSRAGRQVALMPFVEGGYDEGSEPRQQGISQQHSPLAAERSAPSPEHEKAEHPVAYDVPGLAQVMMEDQKVIKIDVAEKVSQQVVEHAAGVRG